MATLTVNYTISVSDLARTVAAYQSEANTDINGTATNAQVIAYIKKSLKQVIASKVQSFENAAAVAAIVPVTAPDLT